jgi:hypothetical protein
MARRRERGATMVLVVVGMAALIAMAGLALDTAHVLLNKARLQSALDAAALAGAKALDQSTSTAWATTAATSVFDLNVAEYRELQRAGLTLTTEFSASLPFSAGTVPATFVRTKITGFATSMSLIRVLGISSVSVAGSAVAGPSPSVVQGCNIAPVAMCRAPGGGPPFFGYTLNQVVGLQQPGGGGGGGGGGGAGLGNYRVLSVGGGGAPVRTNLAGDYANCTAIGNTVTTQAGVNAGDVSDGLNTRFGNYNAGLSAANYPPDVINSAANQTALTLVGRNVMQRGRVVTTANQLTFNYASFTALERAQAFDTQPLPAGTAAFDRRVLAVPVVNCGGGGGGGAVAVHGFACVFLLQQLGAGNDVIYGQIINGCESGGKPGAGSTATGPHVIELFQSAGSQDS